MMICSRMESDFKISFILHQMSYMHIAYGGREGKRERERVRERA